MKRRVLVLLALLLLGLTTIPPPARVNGAHYFEDLGTDPELLYLIWSTLVYDADRLSIPVREHIEILVYDAGLSGKEEVLASEEQFRRFLESGNAGRLLERMRGTTRMEMAMLIEYLFSNEAIVHRAKLYPSYVRKVRELILEFEDGLYYLKREKVRELESLWTVKLTDEEGVITDER